MKNYNAESIFLERDYREHCANIFGVLMYYFAPQVMKDKKVIDLGCGLGWYGRRFRAMGAEVLFVDGRKENIKGIKADLPNANTLVLDIENEPLPEKKFDLVICIGLIYHTKTPKLLLLKIAEVADNIVLETSCVDHDGMMIVYHEEAKEPYYSSISGGACHPSPMWCEKELERVGFSIVRDISHGDANTTYPRINHIYDWKFKRTCGWRRDDHSLRKLFIASKSIEKSIFQF